MKKLYSLTTAIAVLFSMTASAVVVNISQSGNSFSPMAVSVNVGDVIHWQWTGGSHTTTSMSVPNGADDWDSPLNTNSQTFDYEVTVAGIYAYVCSFHANMGGGFQATAPSTVEPILSSASAEMSAGVDFNTHSLHVNITNFASANAIMKMIDITGKEVAVLHDGPLSTGQQIYHYDMSGRTPGVYFVRLEQNGKVTTRKVLLN